MSNKQSAVFSAEDLIELARRQRHILFCLLIQFASVAIIFIGSDYLDIAFLLCIAFNYLLTLFFIYFVVKLAIAVQGNTALYVVMYWVFGLLCLLVLNNRTTGILSANGVRVSLLGVNSREMKKLLDRAAAEANDLQAQETPS